MVSGLPPSFQINCRTGFRSASVKARCVPSVRVARPSSVTGDAPGAVPKLSFVPIQDNTLASLRATPSAPDTFAVLLSKYKFHISF